MAAGIQDVVWLVAIPLIPVAIAFPLVDQAWLAFALLGLSLFLGSLDAGPANAAKTSSRPARSRRKSRRERPSHRLPRLKA